MHRRRQRPQDQVGGEWCAKRRQNVSAVEARGHSNIACGHEVGSNCKLALSRRASLAGRAAAP